MTIRQLAKEHWPELLVCLLALISASALEYYTRNHPQHKEQTFTVDDLLEACDHENPEDNHIDIGTVRIHCAVTE